MPLDSMGHTSKFHRNSYLGAELKFVWLPKKCDLTGKYIWLVKAYKLTSIWHSADSAILEHKWHDKNTHIMWLLKR